MGKTFENKVMKEVGETGGNITVNRLKEERWEGKEKGVGCICLTLLEQQYILQLRAAEPTRSNDSYISAIFLYSGNVVSSSFISSFFAKIGTINDNF